MNLLANVLGRLNLEAFQHDLIITGAQVSFILIGAGVFALLTYFKSWKWLWRNWLTSLDPKKIGVMYIVVALLMLLR
ncbi:MAG TPA: cytochrome o ubiquinol oxidase subunit I, partial [Patescibacteria group bacterium]|nr:cytochrome o ubiquinol oxidase subunit I [Patescibacteria group bacterium]